MSNNFKSVDVKKIEKYVKILTDNYQLKLSEIDEYPDVQYSYNIVNDKKVVDNPEFINAILKEYRPSQLMPNTIGSFLFGCFQNNYGDIPMECSPLCAFSIKQEDLRIGKCNHQIFVQYTEGTESSDIRFVKLGNCESKQGYVFVYYNFLGFTKEEKEFFRSNGLYKVQVLVTKDSKHHTVIKMRDISDLPTITITNDGSEFATSEFKEDENIDETTIMYIILSILIVSIIVIYNKN